MDILIATRTYPLDDLKTGREYEARDYMYRKPCGAFVLKCTSDMPGEAEYETGFELAEVFEWLRELPTQIHRSHYTCRSDQIVFE